jgi:hypothetical protein
MSDSDNTHESNSSITNSSSSASSLNSSISSQEFLRDGNQNEIELSSLFSDSEDDVESASVVNQGELRNIIEKRKDYKKIYINRICDLPNDAWDIGYSQLKKRFPNDFNLLNNLLIQLDEIMRPMVYELGFLLK